MDKKTFEHFNFIPEFPDFPDPSPNLEFIIKNPKYFKPQIKVNTSLVSLKEFEKSEAYKKYVLPTLEREKQLKRQKRSEWFWIKGLLILNTIFAGTSAICAVISLLK